MNHPLNTLHSPPQPEPSPDDDPDYFNSEFVLFIGLFIILSFLIFLIALNCCTCLRRRFSHTTTTTNPINHYSLPAAKLLRTIPKVTYSGADKFSDCAICLTEFVVGDEVRVLPRCGHCFHVACVDRWIGSNFTCPSCRQMLLKTTRCNRCDEVPVAGSEATATGETSVMTYE